MPGVPTIDLRRLPSVDEVLRTDAAAAAASHHGRSLVVTAIRDALSDAREGRMAVITAKDIAAARGAFQTVSDELIRLLQGPAK